MTRVECRLDLSQETEGFLHAPRGTILRGGWNVSSMDILSFLANVPLFKGLPADQLGRIARIAVAKDYRRGEIVFSGRRCGGRLLCPDERTDKDIQAFPEGKEQVLHIMGFQEPFGEAPSSAAGGFPPMPRHRGKPPHLFPRARFRRPHAARSNPRHEHAGAPVAPAQRVCRSRRATVPERGARQARILPIYVSDRAGGAALIQLDIPKTLLANVLGTIPETVSRVLGKMASEGIIEVEGRRIRLLDRKKLEELSQGARFYDEGGARTVYRAFP